MVKKYCFESLLPRVFNHYHYIAIITLTKLVETFVCENVLSNYIWHLVYFFENSALRSLFNAFQNEWIKHNRCVVLAVRCDKVVADDIEPCIESLIWDCLVIRHDVKFKQGFLVHRTIPIISNQFTVCEHQEIQIGACTCWHCNRLACHYIVCRKYSHNRGFCLNVCDQRVEVCSDVFDCHITLILGIGLWFARGLFDMHVNLYLHKSVRSSDANELMWVCHQSCHPFRNHIQHALGMVIHCWPLQSIGSPLVGHPSCGDCQCMYLFWLVRTCELREIEHSWRSPFVFFSLWLSVLSDFQRWFWN